MNKKQNNIKIRHFSLDNPKNAIPDRVRRMTPISEEI